MDTFTNLFEIVKDDINFPLYCCQSTHVQSSNFRNAEVSEILLNEKRILK